MVNHVKWLAEHGHLGYMDRERILLDAISICDRGYDHELISLLHAKIDEIRREAEDHYNDYVTDPLE